MFRQAAELDRTKVLLADSDIDKKLPVEDEKIALSASILERVFGTELILHSQATQNELAKIGWRLSGELIVITLLAIFFSQPFLFLLLPILLLVEKSILASRARSRVSEFDKDYTALLLSLASAVKTGLDPLVALSTAKLLFSKESEIYSELSKLQEEIDQGSSEDQAIRSFGLSINHPDLQLFRTAFILARREGSSLAECLQRLARVTRQRQSFRRKISSAIAMQKLSAFGIGGCAVLISIIQAVGNPQAFQTAVNHSFGLKLLIVAGLLVVAGVVWMLRLSRLEEQ